MESTLSTPLISLQVPCSCILWLRLNDWIQFYRKVIRQTNPIIVVKLGSTADCQRSTLKIQNTWQNMAWTRRWHEEWDAIFFKNEMKRQGTEVEIERDALMKMYHSCVWRAIYSINSFVATEHLRCFHFQFEMWGRESKKEIWAATHTIKEGYMHLR